MTDVEEAIKAVRNMKKWHWSDWSMYVSAKTVEVIFQAAVDSIKLREENAELRASLEHLEKLASVRVDEAAKTTKVEDMEGDDGGQESV